MMRSGDLRETSEYVKRKHHYLRRYCNMVATAMKGKWHTLYMDVMAGPGECLIRETGETCDGSPLVALQAFTAFSEYWFCEQDKSQAESLRSRVLERFPAAPATVVQGDWRQTEIWPKSLYSSRTLALAFIDPTGVSQVPWEAVKRLSGLPARMDILLTLQHGMGVRINIPHYLGSEDETALDRFLGTDVWRDRVRHGEDGTIVVFEMYCEQMRKLGFRTAEWQPVRISTGAVLYHVCFFSRHERGMDFWRKAVQIDESGQRTLDF